MDIALLGASVIWPATAVWMQALMFALLVLTLTALILFGGAGALIALWLVSGPARSILYRWSTKHYQQKWDGDIARFDHALHTGLGDLSRRPVVIDIPSACTAIPL